MTKYYASYHPDLIEYGFHVECVGQVNTKMAGSGRGHTCYFYRRSKNTVVPEASVDCEPTNDPESTIDPVPTIDPLFQKGFEILEKANDDVLEWIQSCLQEQVSKGRTRSQTQIFRCG